MNSKLVDWQLVFATTIIILMGLLIHLSVSPQLFNYHLLYILIGIFLAFVAFKIDLQSFLALPKHLYVTSLFLLVLTIVLGTATRGSTRWIDFGFFRFQPSEMVKIILIFSFANFLNHWNFAKFKKLFQLIPLALFPAVLIFIQPDLGSAIVYTLVVSVMTFTAGIRLKHLLILFLAILIISPLFWLSLKDYQKARIHTFINPESDPLGRGYNSIQAIIAVGSGQIFGRGLGHGTQSKLKFLPEHQTDFVFASLAEELGLVGATLLILAYLWLILRLLHITNYTHQRSYYLVMVGITTLVSAQVIINIGMNIGLMPVTGITLPLVSYGGSSIVTILTSLGVAANIARHRQATFAIEIS